MAADYQRQVNVLVTFTVDDASLTSHRWLINGVQESTAAIFVWTPTVVGIYTIRHEGSSICGVCTPVEKTIEVTTAPTAPEPNKLGVGIIIASAVGIGMLYKILAKKK